MSVSSHVGTDDRSQRWVNSSPKVIVGGTVGMIGDGWTLGRSRDCFSPILIGFPH